MKTSFLCRALIAGLALVLAATLAPGAARGSDTGDESDTPPRFKAKGGDPDLKLRHRLRILVPYDRTLFFVDRGKPYGTMAALGRALETWINRTHEARTRRVTVDLVPVARDRLLAALVAGQGDVAAADLAITQDRLVDVDFTEPWMTAVADLVVAGPAAPALGSIDDLAGAEIYVRRSSRYAGELAMLNEKLTAKGLDSITVTPGDESLEDEDLLEMVNAGLLPMTVVDARKAELWARILPNLRVRTDLVVGTGGPVGWAVRKGSPELRAALSAFLRTRAAAGTGVAAVKRPFGRIPFATNAYADGPLTRFDQMLDLFRRYGDQYGIDNLMLAALGYQESQLDQSRRGAGGAVGVMQLMPATAALPEIGIDGVAGDAERNIEAGAKYLRLLIDTYLDDPEIDAKDRLLMALAAYKAGPADLARFRAAARKAGLNPNVWFDNVENGAARVAGRGVVQYVRDVYEYAVAYELLLAKEKR